MNQILVPARFRIIGHRGAAAYAPENTLPAFALARKLGITEVELDVQLSSDGVVVVCHDTSLVRYGHGDAIVELLHSKELLSLDMGSWFSPAQFANTPLITLAQLFDAFGDSFIYHIELKGRASELPAATFQIVSQYNLESNAIFTSFSLEQLMRMHSSARAARLGWLVQSVGASELEKAAAVQLFQLCPRADTVTESLVIKCMKTVSEVRAWGLHGQAHEVRARIHQLLASGCHGTTIDWPDWLKKEKPGDKSTVQPRS